MTSDAAPTAMEAPLGEALAGDADARRTDRLLTVAMWLVGVAVLVFGAYFAYDVRQTRQAQLAADPSYQLIQQLTAQVKAKPNDPLARALLAEALGSAGQFDAAKQQLKAAIQINPKYAGAYMDVAKIAILEKDSQTAKQALQKVLELTEDAQFQNVNQRREEAYFLLGELALTEHKYEEAIAHEKAAIRINRGDSDAYLRLAQAYAGLGDREATEYNLKVALAFDPKFPEANYELGKLYLAEGDRVQAAEAFQTALQGDPKAVLPAEALASIGDFETYEASATAAAKAGNNSGALDAARIARAMDPKSVEAAVLEAQLLEKLGRTEDARSVWQNVLSLDPANASATRALARLDSKKRKKGGSK